MTIGSRLVFPLPENDNFRLTDCALLRLEVVFRADVVGLVVLGVIGLSRLWDMTPRPVFLCLMLSSFWGLRLGLWGGGCREACGMIDLR